MNSCFCITEQDVLHSSSPSSPSDVDLLAIMGPRFDALACNDSSSLADYNMPDMIHDIG